MIGELKGIITNEGFARALRCALSALSGLIVVWTCDDIG